MTTLTTKRSLRRETSAFSRGKALVIELGPHMLSIRPKGARWKYEVDYQAIFSIGAKKKAEIDRLARLAKRRGKGA